MNVTVELERDDNLTIRHWEEFLTQARRAGASDDTPVAEYMHSGTTDHVAYRVEITDPSPTGPEHVVVPTLLIHELLSVVSIVAGSDGDVRGLEGAAQRAFQSAYDYLLLPILGENPYSTTDDSEEASPS